MALGDCLELTGWWPSSIGKLQQTKGFKQRNTQAAASGQIHSISETDARVYYASGGNVYQVGRNSEAAIDTGYDGSPLGLIGYQGFMWIMNRDKQSRDNGLAMAPWPVETPDAPSDSTDTDGELPDGDYEYYVTFIDTASYESNPSPVDPVTLSGGDNGEVTITRPTADTPSLIQAWNVYRKGPGLFAIYKVNVVQIAYGTTTYVDNGSSANEQTNEDLIGRDEVMEQDHDNPPPARVMADRTFNDRLVMASSEDFPNRIWYTRASQPAYVPSDQSVDCGNDREDAILAISVKNGFFIIYRQRSIWRHVGDFDDETARIEPLVPDMGVVGHRAWCATSEGDFFVGGRASRALGIYRLGDTPQSVSMKIDPIFHNFDLENYTILDQSTAADCALGYNAGRLWFSYKNTLALPNVLILDTKTARWFSLFDGHFGVFYGGSQFFLAGWDTAVASMEDGLGANGGALIMAFQSAYEDCGFPDREKTWADLVLQHYTNGVNATIRIKTNKALTGGGVDEFVIATINSVTLTKQVIPLVYPNDYTIVAKRGKPIRAFNLAVRVDAASSVGFMYFDTPILLHYYLEARKGKTFDSGPTNHGIIGVKRVDRVEIDIDASEGSCTLQIQSDIPGGEMVARLGAGLTIAQTSGREVVTVVLDTPVDGKLLRYQVTSASEFGVYGFRARVLPIGVHVDGQQNESWNTEPLPIGA